MKRLCPGSPPGPPLTPADALQIAGALTRVRQGFVEIFKGQLIVFEARLQFCQLTIELLEFGLGLGCGLVPLRPEMYHTHQTTRIRC